MALPPHPAARARGRAWPSEAAVDRQGLSVKVARRSGSQPDKALRPAALASHGISIEEPGDSVVFVGGAEAEFATIESIG